jgi:uncharacterized phage protein (TIGR01671 family)
MREIKFRTYDEILCYYREQGQIQISSNGEPFQFIPLNGGYKIDRLKGIKIEFFIGLKDKNGVEIYCGDLIKTERNTVEIFFGKKEFHVIFYGKKDIIEVNGWLVKNKRGEVDVLDSSFCDGEIIGNIHQNPELLNQ